MLLLQTDNLIQKSAGLTLSLERTFQSDYLNLPLQHLVKKTTHWICDLQISRITYSLALNVQKTYRKKRQNYKFVLVVTYLSC